mmetsp:Transcript_19608/g.60861  ORF Transcript_19608/g.60861 Transcript_19608/m.60861 type:complete len:169 (-) Transcript_19608:39-545(-)
MSNASPRCRTPRDHSPTAPKHASRGPARFRPAALLATWCRIPAFHTIGLGSAAAVSVLVAVLPRPACITIVGFVASGGSVALFSAPLASLRDIVAKRDASVLTPLMLFFSLATSGLWTLYAVLIHDGFMLVPNGLGLLLSLAQLGLFVRYHKPAEVAGIGLGAGGAAL